MTGRIWAFLFFQIRVLGLTSRASVRAVIEGYGFGTDPTALLGWRVECLAQFYIPINCPPPPPPPPPPPSPCVRTAWARAVINPATVVISTCLLKYGLIKPDRRHTWCVNDGPLGFALVFHTPLVFPYFLSTSSASSPSGPLPFFLFSVLVLCFLLDFRLPI